MHGDTWPVALPAGLDWPATASPHVAPPDMSAPSLLVLRGRDTLRVRAGAKVKRGCTRRSGADGVGGLRPRLVRALGGGV
eukprot:3803214-Alexandrium_andersonii.AAC.1